MHAMQSQGRVLVVEDEEALAGLVTRYLRHASFAAEFVTTGLEALERARSREPDVLVLDLGLPGMDGLEVCRRVREFSDCYIIMLTARAEEADRLTGLAIGADDYLTKPFSQRELVARVQVLLRRPRTASPAGAMAFGNLRIDTVGREVRLDEEPVELTPIEFDLLGVLAAAPSAAFSRARLVEKVWGPSWVGDDRLVDVHIAHLRRKLGDDPSDPVFVRTVRGIGYRMGPGQ